MLVLSSNLSCRGGGWSLNGKKVPRNLVTNGDGDIV